MYMPVSCKELARFGMVFFPSKLPLFAKIDGRPTIGSSEGKRLGWRDRQIGAALPAITEISRFFHSTTVIDDSANARRLFPREMAKFTMHAPFLRRRKSDEVLTGTCV